MKEDRSSHPSQRFTCFLPGINDGSILKHAFTFVFSVFSTGFIFRRKERRELYSMRDGTSDMI